MINRRFVIIGCCAFVLFLIMGGSTPAPASHAAAQGLPAGFIITQVASGLTLPTDMAILPDGDILVTEKGSGDETSGTAAVRLIKDGQLAAAPVITLAVNASFDSGLLAVVLDPNFATNRHFYLWYATAQGAKNWSGSSKMRLSRLTFDPLTGTAAPASETIILDNLLWGPLHHGNGLQFDSDGTLLIGLGDRTAANQAQDFSDWQRGKIIRIKPQSNGSYTIPADNPFIGIPAIPDIIYSFGVRNPYRIARRQSDGLMVFGDVGENAWEEVNLMEPSKNYGWPIREGPCERGQLTNCSPSGSGYTDPLIAYQHDPSGTINESGAITGLSFYEGNGFPAAYRGKLFWADFNERYIAYADPANPGAITIFYDQAFFITDLEYWLHGLYTLHIGSGEINVIHYQGGSNQIPTAVLTATPDAATANSSITFSAAGSSDPDDTALTYHWDFGDGQSAITSTPSTSHTYATDGTYSATLEVRDPRGGRSAKATQIVTIYSGEFPTVNLTINNSPGRSIYHGGDAILYEAIRSNNSGLDATRPYSWQINMHHNDHVHPIVTSQVAQSGTFNVPTDNHDHDWNIWYDFRLTMTTAAGQEIVVSQEIFANVVDLTIDQSPGRSTIVVNQVSRSLPYSFKAIAGVNQTLVPPDQLVSQRNVYAFDSWRWFATPVDTKPADITNVLASPYHFAAPAENTTYVAEYTYLKPAEINILPFIAR